MTNHILCICFQLCQFGLLIIQDREQRRLTSSSKFTEMICAITLEEAGKLSIDISVYKPSSHIIEL